MIRLIETVLRLILLLLLGVGLIFSYARWVEPRFIDETQLILSDTVAETTSIPGGYDDSLRMAVFADVHFSDYYGPEDFQRVVDRINTMEPDLVFFLGDLIDNFNTYTGDTQLIIDALNQIQTSGRISVTMENDVSHDKFAVFGNHDYGGGLETHYRTIMEAGGFHVLVNDTVEIPELNLTITGIDDMVIGYGDVTCASVLSENTYNIVLSHEPDVITEMTDYPVDLMLSGHTHGGQVNVPILSDYFLPPYGKIFVSGEYRFENARETLLYVNRGLGTTKLPLRFMSPPELTELIIQ